MSKTITYLILSIITLLTACQSQQVMRRTPNFQYSAPSTQAIGSAGLTFGLVNPIFLNKEIYVAPEPFKQMAINMGNDFEELLTGKGYTIRGPFNSRDEMVYSDKTHSDMILGIEINIVFGGQRNVDLIKAGTVNFNGLRNYRTSGNITLAGNLVLTGYAPMTMEKIWKKNISLEQFPVVYKGTKQWEGVQPTIWDEIAEDNAVHNAILKELEKYYVSALNLAWKQIDLEDMKLAVAEAKKADAKK